MMNRSTLDSIVPIQSKGKKTMVQITANCYSLDAAVRLYETLKMTLTDVNNWGNFKPGIRFYPKLMNREGQYVDRNAAQGDLIKILLPRWQAVGRLFDWRKITRIEERMTGNIEIFFMTMVPTVNPDSEMPEKSLYLKPESSLTFFIVRDEHKIQLEVHARNESVNFQMTRFTTRLQSAMMGVYLVSGFYKTQWSRLMRSILKYGMSRMSIAN